MKFFAMGVSFMVITVLVAGVMVIGTPAQQRNEQFDQQRVADLMSLQNQIVMYWQKKHNLPKNLDVLNDPIVGFSAPHDPQTLKPYHYETTGDHSFALCTTFVAKSSPETLRPLTVPVPYPVSQLAGTSWDHPSGGFCFERTIDTDFFPSPPEPSVK